MPYSIGIKQLSPQPVLVVRRRVKQSEIAQAIGEALPRVFAYAQSKAIPLAGPPFARYPEMGPGLMTLDIGMPVAATPDLPDAEVRADTLPGGLAAVRWPLGILCNGPGRAPRSQRLADGSVLARNRDHYAALKWLPWLVIRRACGGCRPQISRHYRI